MTGYDEEEKKREMEELFNESALRSDPNCKQENSFDMGMVACLPVCARV